MYNDFATRKVGFSAQYMAETIVTLIVAYVYYLSPHILIGHFSTSSQNGDAALITASSKGHSSAVRKLLQAGATVNTTNKVSDWLRAVTIESLLMVGVVTVMMCGGWSLAESFDYYMLVNGWVWLES